MSHPVDLRPHAVDRIGPAWARWSTPLSDRPSPGRPYPLSFTWTKGCREGATHPRDQRAPLVGSPPRAAGTAAGRWGSSSSRPPTVVPYTAVTMMMNTAGDHGQRCLVPLCGHRPQPRPGQQRPVTRAGSCLGSSARTFRIGLQYGTREVWSPGHRVTEPTAGAARAAVPLQVPALRPPQLARAGPVEAPCGARPRPTGWYTGPAGAVAVDVTLCS
jgi:hypothetical protein